MAEVVDSIKLDLPVKKTEEDVVKGGNEEADRAVPAATPPAVKKRRRSLRSIHVSLCLLLILQTRTKELCHVEDEASRSSLAAPSSFG